MIYVSMDGDDIGRILTGLIYQHASDQEIAAFSRDVEQAFIRIGERVVHLGGCVVYRAGDSILFRIEADAFSGVLETIHPDKFTISAGTGSSVLEAHWALNVAKSLGKARIVEFERIRNEYFRPQNPL